MCPERDLSSVPCSLALTTPTTQCEAMISRHHVYAFPKDGRISIAGLSTTTCPKLAHAMHDALTNP